jgi:hypothetical protein
LKIFLNVISPGNEWAAHLRGLIREHPAIEVKRMGVADDWDLDVFWKD